MNNSFLLSGWGVSLAVVVAGCASPGSDQGTGPTSGDRSSPQEESTAQADVAPEDGDGKAQPDGPVNLVPTAGEGPQSGIQLGDEGSDAPRPLLCGREELSDLSLHARDNPLSAGQWRDSLSAEQVGRATVRIQRERSCSVELDYELQLDPSDARLWLEPLGHEEKDGQCTSREEYLARDVHMKLFIEGRLALAADIEATSDAVLEATALAEWPQGRWSDQFEEIASDTLFALEEHCEDESFPNSDAGPSAAARGDGGGEAFRADAGALAGDGGLEVPWCTTNLAPDASVAPVLPDCAPCLADHCGEPDCKADATCNAYLECLNACSGDTACLRDCGDPDCATGDEASCYLLDCRNWGTCSPACGYGRPCDPWEPGPPSARIRDLALSRDWNGSGETTPYAGYVNAFDFEFRLLP